MIKKSYIGMIGNISVGYFRNKDKYQEFIDKTKKSTHRLVAKTIKKGEGEATKEIVEWRTGKKRNKKRVDKISMVIVEKKIRNG